MATLSGLLSTSSVLGYNKDNSMLSFHHGKVTATNTKYLVNFVPSLMKSVKKQSFCVKRVGPSFAMSRGGDYGLKFDDGYNEDPIWLQLYKDSARALKVLFTFLVQQPGQLKYIEWPSFKDTLRTAALTLVLVAALIVILSSVDSALSFLLAFLLRKPA